MVHKTPNYEVSNGRRQDCKNPYFKNHYLLSIIKLYPKLIIPYYWQSLRKNSYSNTRNSHFFSDSLIKLLSIYFESKNEFPIIRVLTLQLASQARAISLARKYAYSTPWTCPKNSTQYYQKDRTFKSTASRWYNWIIRHCRSIHFTWWCASAWSRKKRYLCHTKWTKWLIEKR